MGQRNRKERVCEEAKGRGDVDTLIHFIIVYNLVISAWNILNPEHLLPTPTSLPKNFYLFFKTLTQMSPPWTLSILRSSFPLSSPPLLPPPPGLHPPGPQMPSSQVICFAKILFRFDKLWPSQLTQHDSAGERIEKLHARNADCLSSGRMGGAGTSA